MKTAFIGFGEVNTPVEVIVSRAGKAAEALEKEGLELVKVLPVADDYEEVQIKNAIETLKKERRGLGFAIAGLAIGVFNIIYGIYSIFVAATLLAELL